MAIKTIYLGSEGPFKYDDTELVNDPDGLFSGILQQTIVTDGNLFATVVVGGAKLKDTNESNFLDLIWNEDDTIDRILNLLVNAANRSINLSGDLVVSAGAGTLNQSVASGASPTFSPALHTQGTDTTLGTMAADVAMGNHKLTGLAVPTDAGDSIRATAKITEVLLESATDLKHTQGTDTTLGDMTKTITLRAGTTQPDTAPQKFKTGSLLSSIEPGALEFDGTDLYITVAL